jgi:hypothetical protein
VSCCKLAAEAGGTSAVGSRYQTTTGEDIAVCALVNCKVRELVKRLQLLVVTDLYGFTESDHQSKPCL